MLILDIDIAAFQVYFPSLEITIHRQRFDYTIDQVAKASEHVIIWLFQLFSELGGAAGLVLGISLITIVRQVDATITWIIRHFKLKFGYGKNLAPTKPASKFRFSESHDHESLKQLTGLNFWSRFFSDPPM